MAYSSDFTENEGGYSGVVNRWGRFINWRSEVFENLIKIQQKVVMNGESKITH